MRERILLLSWSVPPETSGSAIIVGNLAREFSRTEMVVAGERPYKRPLVLWKEEWPEIVYLTTGWPESRRGARWWRRLQFPLLFIRCLWLVRKYRCKTILVVFPNVEFLLAGYWTAVLTKSRLYPYFHNTFLEQCTPKSLHWRLACWLQSRVFAEAQRLFVISEGLAELYRERCPSVKCSAIVHTFYEAISDFTPPPEPARPLRLIISGNINESCRDATVRVCSAISQFGEASLTILSGTAKEYLLELGILHNGVQYETLSRDYVVKRLGEADIIILTHGFFGGLSPVEYRTIFPTKTIECLISGRPILMHAPPNCYLTRFFEEHGCALIVDEPSVQAVITGIKRLHTDARLRSTLVRNALRTAEKYQASIVAKTLRSALEST